MSETFRDVTVAVPISRLGDFHVLYGRWLSGETPFLHEQDREGPPPGDIAASTQKEMLPWGIQADDGVHAHTLWEQFSPTAQAIIELLMEEPETEYSGEEIASRLGIEKGKFGVAGALAWPGRYASAIYRQHPVKYREAEDGQARYRMDKDTALMFKAAAAGRVYGYDHDED